MILAIDPGNEKSGYCFYDGERVVGGGWIEETLPWAEAH